MWEGEQIHDIEGFFFCFSLSQNGWAYKIYLTTSKVSTNETSL